MTKRSKKKDNITGIVGVLALFGVAWYDEKWRVFWGAAAALILLWTLASIFLSAGKK